MHEHELELWTTALFNDFLAAPLDALLTAIGHPAADPAHPWETWLVMELLVVAILVVTVAFVRSRLSVDNLGNCSTFEGALQFSEHPAKRWGSSTLKNVLFRHVVHLHSGDEPDRDHSWFRIADDGLRGPRGCPYAPGFTITPWVCVNWACGNIWLNFWGRVVAGLVDDSDRDHRSLCTYALADGSSLRQHVCRRSDYQRFITDLSGRPWSSWPYTSLWLFYRLTFLLCSR